MGSPTDHLEVVQRITAVAEQRRHRLAQVEHATAADRDHHVRAAGPAGLHRGASHFDRRFAGDGDHLGGYRQGIEKLSVPLGSRAGEHQRPGAPPVDECGQLRGAPRPEQHPVRGGELE